MIRTVVVDDHAVVRSGIRLLLEREEDIEVVGEAGNAKDAIFRARALKPDVILLDVVMPGQSGIEVQLEATLDGERLPGEVETTLYRIVQEALTNTIKHAGARKISILLMRRGGAATAVIEDDGRGFDPTAVREDGLGLLGMRERVALLEGKLTVESSPDAGTTLVAEVPLR